MLLSGGGGLTFGIITVITVTGESANGYCDYRVF